jgi:23S rRNA pseudouridine2605 synthase
VVELTEGKNREIRRMMKALGHDVTRLKRIAFGGIELGDLAAGRWRQVTQSEVRRAFAGARMRDPIAPRAHARSRTTKTYRP